MNGYHIYVEQLITEVEARPVIYNKAHSAHRIREVVNKAWKEISVLMNVDQKVLKKKWKNLKDAFRAKQRKLSLPRSTRTRKREWIFYDKMLFLSPYTDITGPSSNYSTVPVNDVGSSSSGRNCGNKPSIENTSDNENTYKNLSEKSLVIIKSEYDDSIESSESAPAAKFRKMEQMKNENSDNKILNTFPTLDKENQATNPPQSSIRQFFSAMATKAEALSEYDQHILEMSCNRVYAQLKFPEMSKDMIHIS